MAGRLGVWCAAADELSSLTSDRQRSTNVVHGLWAVGVHHRGAEAPMLQCTIDWCRDVASV